MLAFKVNIICNIFILKTPWSCNFEFIQRRLAQTPVFPSIPFSSPLSFCFSLHPLCVLPSVSSVPLWLSAWQTSSAGAPTGTDPASPITQKTPDQKSDAHYRRLTHQVTAGTVACSDGERDRNRQTERDGGIERRTEMEKLGQRQGKEEFWGRKIERCIDIVAR